MKPPHFSRRFVIFVIYALQALKKYSVNIKKKLCHDPYL